MRKKVAVSQGVAELASCMATLYKLGAAYMGRTATMRGRWNSKRQALGLRPTQFFKAVR